MYGQFKKEISTFLCNMEGIDLQGLPGKWQKSDHNAGMYHMLLGGCQFLNLLVSLIKARRC